MKQAISWKQWGTPDPEAEQRGFKLGPDEPAGKICAPAGRFRVCAYHIDWDEQPRCYVDVSDERDARQIANGVPGNTSHNVDYAVVFNENGEAIIDTLYGPR